MQAAARPTPTPAHGNGAAIALCVVLGIFYVSSFAYLKQNSRDFIAESRTRNAYAPGTPVSWIGSSPYAFSGWSVPEGWGTWGIGATSEIALSLGAAPAQDLELVARVTAYTVAGKLERREVTVVANGRPVATWQILHGIGPVEQRARIPREVMGADGRLRIAFRTSELVSPAKLQGANDPRELGIGLVGWRIDALASK